MHAIHIIERGVEGGGALETVVSKEILCTRVEWRRSNVSIMSAVLC